MLKKGQRVETVPFGMGEIVGFEHIADNLSRVDIVDDDPGKDSRVIVKLDNPAAWILASEKQPHPYMMRSDIKKAD